MHNNPGHQVATVAHNIVGFVVALVSSETKMRVGIHAPSRKRQMAGRYAEHRKCVSPVGSQ
jgi:hypothetical protein